MEHCQFCGCTNEPKTTFVLDISDEECEKLKEHIMITNRGEITASDYEDACMVLDRGEINYEERLRCERCNNIL